MTDDVVVWNRLADLLPEVEAQEVRDCWDIGEQEAGLGLLVSGLLLHQMPLSETVRAEISVLAETWGEREALTPRILQCRGDDAPTQLKLIEDSGGTAEEMTGGSGQDLADLVLVPWIACTRCGQALMRAHVRERWGELSYLARRYVITSPDRATVLLLFPAESAGVAFTALRNGCACPQRSLTL
ncbi:hypothetical protein [Streptomyces sp. RKAG337]|uniref:hypothetical protein n=1 Tax=Streptomyces sp. RKAG337 TaxID=2893404 RepID=UPI0020347CA3|nr:hypothetical protein [Streptomyces sp. RKAG337]MCM2425181.1 hypothetical protein [Streptomyces sp. RKAG337]